tara:strand:- start:168 stop:485 length:318 start_codon:yes stop_codon:yes gene_type:complete
MNVVHLTTMQEKAKGLIGMKPIPYDTLFVFHDIQGGQKFHSQGVLEPFHIIFRDSAGRNLSRKLVTPPYGTARAPIGTDYAVEMKVQSPGSGPFPSSLSGNYLVF